MNIDQIQHDCERELLALRFEAIDNADQVIPEEMNEYLDSKNEPWWYLVGYSNQAEAYGI